MRPVPQVFSRDCALLLACTVPHRAAAAPRQQQRTSRAPNAPRLAAARPPSRHRPAADAAMAALVGQAVKAFSTQLQRHPWRTQIVTTGALW